VSDYEHECRIRDYYASELDQHRPGELLIARENSPTGTSVRADMKTIDRNNTIRIWEFKIRAGHSALGQILVYVAMTRRAQAMTHRTGEHNPLIRGVIAAFDFHPTIIETVETLNLNIELVTLPPVLALAGAIPANLPPVSIPSIPALDSKFAGPHITDHTPKGI
jgi:hypothetical protein